VVIKDLTPNLKYIATVHCEMLTSEFGVIHFFGTQCTTASITLGFPQLHQVTFP